MKECAESFELSPIMRAKPLTPPDPNLDLLQKQGLLTGHILKILFFSGHHFYWEKYIVTLFRKKLIKLLNRP